MWHVNVADVHCVDEKTYRELHEPFFKWLVSEFGTKKFILDFDGDILDNRKSTQNFIIETLPLAFEEFEKNFEEVNISIGNHDVITSHNVDNRNILRTKFRHNKRIFVHDKITVRGDHIYFPYTFKDSPEFEQIKEISNPQDYILVGHFELDSYYPDSEFALPYEFFSKFKHSFAGHYHHPLTYKNFTYTGMAFEQEFQPKENDVPRGVWIYDSDNFEQTLKFVVYPAYKKFHTFYVDSNDSFEEFVSKSQKLSNANIRVKIDAKYKSQVIDELKSIVSVLDRNNKTKIENTELEVEEEKVESISVFSSSELGTLIEKTIDATYVQEDKVNFKKYAKELLSEFLHT